MDQLERKVARIAGAARGPGQAEAVRFAAEGAHVVVADVLGGEAREVASSIGDAAIHVRLDLTSEASRDAAVAATIERLGGLEVLDRTGTAAYLAALAADYGSTNPDGTTPRLPTYGGILDQG